MRHASVLSVLNHVLLVSLAAACGGQMGAGLVTEEPDAGSPGPYPPYGDDSYDAATNADGENGPDATFTDAGENDVILLPDIDILDSPIIRDTGVDVWWDSASCQTLGKPDALTCFYSLPFVGDPASCGFQNTLPVEVGPSDVCSVLCGQTYAYCYIADPDAGSLTLQCTTCRTGRRPEGLPPLARASRPARSRRALLGHHFAEVAYLEAASVDAFRILRDELATHRAPPGLVRAAARAARDEIRHARATGALARRFGGSPIPAPHTARRRGRSLEAIALENAVEGCVRETYGALVAGWQARTAGDPVIRAAMQRIARDEAEHAALSWRVARWAEPRLGRAARERVAAARRGAAQEIKGEARTPPSPLLVRATGLPRAEDAERLVTGLLRTVWA
jgi:hypothetical protein